MDVDEFEAELKRADVPYGLTYSIKILRKCKARVYDQVVTVRLPKEKGYTIYKILTSKRVEKMSAEDVGLFITTYKLNCLFTL